MRFLVAVGVVFAWVNSLHAQRRAAPAQRDELLLSYIAGGTVESRAVGGHEVRSVRIPFVFKITRDGRVDYFAVSAGAHGPVDECGTTMQPESPSHLLGVHGSFRLPEVDLLALRRVVATTNFPELRNSAQSGCRHTVCAHDDEHLFVQFAGRTEELSAFHDLPRAALIDWVIAFHRQLDARMTGGQDAATPMVDVHAAYVRTRDEGVAALADTATLDSALPRTHGPGSLPLQDLVGVLVERRGELSRCDGELVNGSRANVDQMRAQLSIGGDGRVEHVSFVYLRAQEISVTAAGRCVKDVLRSWRFPPPTGYGLITVELPLAAPSTQVLAWGRRIVAELRELNP